MTAAEFYTAQFYTWEYRGRGWYIADEPIALEPPFMPFFRHGFPEKRIDDGKRHSIISKLFAKPTEQPTILAQAILDYEQLEFFPYQSEEELKAIQLKLPKDKKPGIDKMKALLTMLSTMQVPLSFEIIGTATTIIFQFVVPASEIDVLETYLTAFFPTVALLHDDFYVENIIDPELSTYLVDFGLEQEFTRPLQMNSSLDPLIGIVAVLDRLQEQEQGVVQVLLQPTVNKWEASIVSSVTMHDGSSFFVDDFQAPQFAKQKIQSPLYGVAIRAVAQAEELNQAHYILQKLSSALMIGIKSATNELIPLSEPSYDFTTRATDIRFRESHRMGMLLNMDELLNLVHLPTDACVSKKLTATTRKTKAVPAIAKGKECVLGKNSHNGIEETVSISQTDRLKHTHIIGATGTGKSTLLANMIVQDAKAGVGVVLFDPHGDLVDEVVAQLPEERLKDVVYIDPSDIDYPIGINILQAFSDHEKELLSSDLVAVIRKYATSWGDQMSAVLGNAILAILESKDGGTLHDLRRFLIEKDFRSSILSTVTDPAVSYYWLKEYPLQKSTSIGPILTRLDTFLRPRAIRNMLVQRKGIDIEKLLNENKIILLKLSHGLMGIENSFLLGSLILSKLHQAILRRQDSQNRSPLFIYLDEFQHFMTPSIKEMISGVRKYQVGLILSHQDLQQLQREDGELLNSVLGNCYTRVIFRVGEPDAKKLQEGLSGFDHHDLQSLGRGEAIVRIEQPQFDCSLDTYSLPDASEETREANKRRVITHTRAIYSSDRATVEEALFETFGGVETEHPKPEPKEPPKEQPKEKKEPVQPTPKEKPEPIITPPPTPTEEQEPVVEETQEDQSTHRYLQVLVKKMAEARGYVATLEAPLPQAAGQVDVLLAKEDTTIAIEISHTTEPDWEVHNIKKCLDAGFTLVVSMSGDPKQLSRIKEKCTAAIQDFDSKPVLFFTPDAFFSYLDSINQGAAQEETTMKGYRVKVSYDAIGQDEMERKRASVAKVVMDSLRKRKKKE
ncbi:MAG: DUF853 family protein [Bacteroidetes bacterium]|nr:DUF853 family protein [Bacteroidota bacterium]